VTLAVFGVMRDKDIDAVIAPLMQEVDYWHLVDLKVPRAMPTGGMRERLLAAGVDSGRIELHADLGQAWTTAVSMARPADRLLAFGSFWLVGDLIRLLEREGDGGRATKNPAI
jgi:dihydrofolate synthase/folylpolyglutamate synthase